ncbi:helix-turn-helix domain-containing protein [Streptomonospora sp. PA3]|uniref:helix-turn-helix domain-containing protein n=1 Tax=Streptomonospora sp. PA3 TaxID=2607326 RepID=UPI0012DC4869|nr:helix-turn-helix transcriptional regulator [Streptomonospora sp. PA3]MUL41650.1 helix-turn-helix domain-containing protein [Streptomonospora sp. PA3]
MQGDQHQDRGPLAEFLSARRALVSARDAGLTGGGPTRRVPGLRREEVAQLAGISVDYYTRLEQGRLRTASRTVLNSIGKALGLDADQRLHLFKLANPDIDMGAAEDEQRVSPGVERLLEGLVGMPALVFGRYLDILAWNSLAAALLGDLAAMAPRRRNYVRMVFLEPATRAVFLDWRERAREAVSFLRMNSGARNGQPRLQELVGELSVRDDDFRRWWNQHLVSLRPFGATRVAHPAVGEFALEWEVLAAVEDDEQHIGLLSAAPGTPDHAAVLRLADWARECGVRSSAETNGTAPE